MATVPQGNVGKPRFGPSDRLIAIFRACSRDPTDAVKTRLRRMLHLFLQHHRDDEGRGRSKVLAVKCCCEAETWYYRILENLLIQERQRLGISDVSDMLEYDLLQSCLVACCLEISVTSNHLSCDFPLLQQLLNVASYQFWKVIEPVLRLGVGLPGLVVKHLAQVEVKVLESLAWTRDSPLWEEIRANEGHMPACQQVMLPTQLEGSIRTDFPSTLNRPRRSSSFHLFARKVYILMGVRLRGLCSALDISDELRLKTWTCFEYSLVHCTSLMVDRHLDQLLMCAIYIIAKISQMEIPFKRIMKCYESQPHTSRSVCKNVLISEKDDAVLTPRTPSAHYPGPSQVKRGNLIYFYNQTYTTKMQHFAKQFAPTFGGDTPPLSPYPQLKKASPRRQRLPCSPTIFVSPYNAETITPFTSRLCYYFNSSPSECLCEINNMIRTGRSPRRSCYALSMDREDGEDEDGDDGPSAKRLRLNSQSAWQRRLRNVMNDRITRQNQDQVQSFPVNRSMLH
ncbi:retinoblastoma-like protein 2 isoform X2 [Parambassis ranga]|nr:retinoblastoma-like protein 2 isoform X2 [Parambassis ranga]XP_028258653.1 retinoblastoma-like protein 2 isoform X2 [Parambassis ranga]